MYNHEKTPPGERQATKFIKEYIPKFPEDLLNKDRITMKVIVALLTGDCRLNNLREILSLNRKILYTDSVVLTEEET